MQTERAKNKQHRIKGHSIVTFSAGLLLCVVFASAQVPANNTIKRFRAPLRYFDPPHELQMQSFLEGAEAEPQSDGLILIRDAKLQTFHEDGTRDMTVTAPHCLFDSKEQTVSDAGPLQVQTSDEKLLLEGQGFFWRQTNSDLIISNRVSTTIRGPLTNSFAP